MLPIPKPQFPTPLHADAAATAADFFHAQEGVDTVLLVNSCARGVATPESDIDMVVLAAEGATDDSIRALEMQWRRFADANAILDAYKRVSPFAAMHVDVVNGRYEPYVWDDGGGPDYFEVGIGNHIAYSAVLGSAGPHFQHLRARWLPYYAEALRSQRLSMVRAGCLRDLDFIPFYIKRELHYQAFDRLYKAFQEFLQGLFIARGSYPIAYNKWLREQVVSWLELPQVYAAFRRILSIGDIESDDVAGNANRLSELVETWLV